MYFTLIDCFDYRRVHIHTDYLITMIGSYCRRGKSNVSQAQKQNLFHNCTPIYI